MDIKKELIRVAGILTSGKKDYVYDPDHLKNPVGGGWRKTDHGWTRKESITPDEEKNEVLNEMTKRVKTRGESSKLVFLPSYKSAWKKLNQMGFRIQDDPEKYFSSVARNEKGLTPAEILTLKKLYSANALQAARSVSEKNALLRRGDKNPKTLETRDKDLEVLKNLVRFVKALKSAEGVMVKKPKIIQPDVNPMPPLPQKKYDFSAGTYYASHPKIKDIVDSIKPDIEELEVLNKKYDDSVEVYKREEAKTSEDVHKIFQENGVSSYEELPTDQKEKADGIYEKFNSVYHNQKKESPLKLLYDALSYSLRKLDKRLEKEGIEGFGWNHDATAADMKKRISLIPYRETASKLLNAIKASPKAEIPVSGTYVSVPAYFGGGYEILAIEKTTASGQIRAKNVLTGKQKDFTRRSWIENSKNKAQVLKPELVSEIKAFSEFYSKLIE